MFYKVTLGFTTGATYNMTNVHVFKAAQARRAYFLYSRDFYTLQEILKEFFPSWEQIKIQEEVIGFTCGLMKDPTPLVDHVYETYVDMLCNAISRSGFQRSIERESRLQALGKNFGDTNLFNTLYIESRVPLFVQRVCLL